MGDYFRQGGDFPSRLPVGYAQAGRILRYLHPGIYGLCRGYGCGNRVVHSADGGYCLSVVQAALARHFLRHGAVRIHHAV
ncbi:hypothetical protein D3C75_1226490 [compost metagenome]